MTQESEVKRLAENVSALQQDMAQVGALVERLDVTIEKLTEVSTTVSQLLAVQGNRLEFQEKVAEKLQDLVEKRRTETESYVKDLHVKIDNVEKDLKNEIDESHDSILQKIEQMQQNSTQQHQQISTQQHQQISEKTNDRIARLEKWMWGAVGGSIVIVWLLDKINIPGLFQ